MGRKDTLIKHPLFALPGRKELLKRDMEYDVILIDATETPIERPKKNKNIFTQGRRKGAPFKTQLVMSKDTKKMIYSFFSKVEDVILGY